MKLARSSRRLPLCAALLASLAAPAALRAQVPTEPELRRLFKDMRSDKIRGNCSSAVVRLRPYADQLRDQLLRELYGDADRQARDAILHLLFSATSFVPDERFMRFVLARMPEQDRYVGKGDIADLPSDYIPGGAHWKAWEFIDQHFNKFEPLLAEQIESTRDIWVLWATAWLMKKRGVLERYSGRFTPEVLRRAADNLRNDGQPFNASQTVRLFLLLGKQSLPALQDAAKSRDTQCRNLALATIDALDPARSAADAKRGFAFLASRLNLGNTVFGRSPPSPPWLEDAADRYRDKDSYP